MALSRNIFSIVSVLALTTSSALAAPPPGKGGGNNNNGPLDLPSAFEAMQADTIWSVPNSPQDHISSTFGPRIKSSSNAYDWHRGLDIHGEIGDPILSAYDGEFVGIRNYTSGGTTVIIEHQFPEPVEFQGHQITTWYTLYMHMDEVAAYLVTADSNDEHPIIAAGDQIGTVGMTGSTVNPHLHQEIRVGSRCSLEYQLDNPNSGCSGLFFDPHVHPLFLQPETENGLSLSVSTSLTALEDGVIEISSEDQYPDINRYEFQIRDRKNVRASYVLDLNERTGFDATTNDILDIPDETKPYLSPVPFGYTADHWTTYLVIPASFVTNKNNGESFRVIATDIWGNEQSINFGDKKVSW